MKKESVPETNGQPTPQFVRSVKDNIDVMAGRRKNKLSLPTVQTLTFSSPPTQAQCQALNSYVNSILLALQQLAARFDD